MSSEIINEHVKEKRGGKMGCREIGVGGGGLSVALEANWLSMP